MGEAEDYHGFAKIQANNMNCVFFNVGFRNGPEVKAPQNQEDFVAVVRHVFENAEDFGVDASKICISGRSGGGWICAGAANLMAKAGDIDKVKAMFIHVG